MSWSDELITLVAFIAGTAGPPSQRGVVGDHQDFLPCLFRLPELHRWKVC
jgi:hypothetical protein